MRNRKPVDHKVIRFFVVNLAVEGEFNVFQAYNAFEIWEY